MIYHEIKQKLSLLYNMIDHVTENGTKYKEKEPLENL